MPKRKNPGCARRATPDDLLPKGQKLLRENPTLDKEEQVLLCSRLNGLFATLKQSALFNGIRPPSASRPPVNAGEPCGIGHSINTK